MAYIAARTNLELVVPRDLRNTKDPALNEFVQRFRLLNRQDPAWPSVTAYDAVTMAVKAAASPEGEGNLAAEDKVHTGLAGEYSFSSRRVPGEVVRVSADSVVYFP